ncbi:MAG: L-2-amino-thiazoline-4-carboxylic acid hydrolase [Cytophagales bacterium]|nr:L-2-amino-thiazoline-4-carboxylic acid hydrolase [Cytophagales bacterium]
MEKIIPNIAILWFKNQAKKEAHRVLVAFFEKSDVEQILSGYWARYMAQRPEIKKETTQGGTIMVHLAAMSAAFYDELLERGKTQAEATRLFYQVAWNIYKKMGKTTWNLTGLISRNKGKRLALATKLFRFFPFSSPAYTWKDVDDEHYAVAFDCMKCPVAVYFQSKGLSKFCADTWCALDFPLAHLWHGSLLRNGSIAGGAEVCDFRWKTEKNVELT